MTAIDDTRALGERIAAGEREGRWLEVIELIATLEESAPVDAAWIVPAMNALASYHVVTQPLLLMQHEPERLDLRGIAPGVPPYERWATQALALGLELGSRMGAAQSTDPAAVIVLGRLREAARDVEGCATIVRRLDALLAPDAVAFFRARLAVIAGDLAAGAECFRAVAPMYRAPRVVPIAPAAAVEVAATPTTRLMLYHEGRTVAHTFATPQQVPQCDTHVDVEVVGRYCFAIDRQGVAHIDGLVSEPEQVFRIGALRANHAGERGARVHVAAWAPHALLLDVPRPRTRHLSRALLLGSGYSENYYHWLFEVLPRLALLDDLGDPALRLLVPGPLRPWQAETLALLGMDAGRLEVIADDESVTVGELFAPRTVAREGMVDDWAIAWVRTRLARPADRGSARLYLARKSQLRLLAGDAEVEAAVRARGYTIVEPASRTVAEQIALFADAAVIAAPTGAALSNVAFAPAGAQLVSLNPRTFVGPTFLTQARACGQDAHVVLGVEVTGSVQQPHWGYRVDPADVVRALEAAEAAAR
ncbi:MAG: glycosyltransferase family 61 protein [Gemmatimonadaceae bacterium]|nr:glycosyltransferase family 61 protein [Gemmatimonadaceae bacterium]